MLRCFGLDQAWCENDDNIYTDVLNILIIMDGFDAIFRNYNI